MPFPRRGGGGGTGSLIVATRSDNNNPAVFANFAALETYTATQDGTTDANRINVTDADDAREVFAVGTLDGSNQVTAITAAYIRLNGAWVAVATNLVGTPGAPGQDGVDGTSLEFESATARDNFFVARPDLLRTDMPLLVGIEGNLDNVIEPQKWKGATSPASYNPATDAVFFVPATLRADSTSFELGEIHRLTSGGENVYTENLNTNTSYAPPWQSVGDHSVPATRVVNNRPDARNWGDFRQLALQGPAAASGSVDFNVPFNITTANLSVFGVMFEIAEDYSGTATLSVDVVASPSNINLTNRVFNIDSSDGDSVMLWFRSPLDARVGTNAMVSLVKPDGSFVASRPQVANPTLTWTEVSFRTFTDEPMAFQSEDVDGISAELNGQSLTITLSRGEGVDDLMTTVTLPTGGGTTPPSGSTAASITRFDIQGQSASVLAGTTIDGTKTFNYNVNHPEDVNGNLRLLQGSTELRNDIDPSANSFTQAITTVTLQNNQQAIFRLTGTTNEGVLIDAFFRVRAHLPPEQLFYGLSGSNNPDTVDTATLSHIEAGIDGSQVSTGTTSAGQYFIILTPNDHDIARAIDALGQEVNSIFTRTVDVRQIGGVQYNSYVFGPVNAGASESYTLRF